MGEPIRFRTEKTYEHDSNLSRCGNPLPPDAPAGLCPVCLLKTDPAAKPAAKANPANQLRPSWFTRSPKARLPKPKGKQKSMD
jgi:hypothetical protein